MAACIVQTSEMVTLVGAGPINRGILEDTLTQAPFLVAADGGAEMVQNCGKAPKAIIGDLDSVPPAVLAGFDPAIVHRIDEQDTTDFDKALRHIRAPLILGLGFLGGRVDHQLSCLRSLAKAAGCACILIGEDDIVFRMPARLVVTLPKATRISFYPVGPARINGAGLAWPLDDLALSFADQVSQSNAVAQGPLALSSQGDVLAILPRAALGAIAQVF